MAGIKNRKTFIKNSYFQKYVYLLHLDNKNCVQACPLSTIFETWYAEFTNGLHCLQLDLFCVILDNLGEGVCSRGAGPLKRQRHKFQLRIYNTLGNIKIKYEYLRLGEKSIKKQSKKNNQMYLQNIDKNWKNNFKITRKYTQKEE